MAATDHGLPTTGKLERVLGPWMATALVVGTVIGSGVFKKPAAVAQDVPTFGWAIAAWVLLGLLVLCGGLALTEVIILYPRAGGNYVFLREGYGRLWGFLWGWVEFFVIRSASLAALASVFAESLHDVLRHESVRAALGVRATGDVLDFWKLQGVTVVTIAVLALVNARGVRWGGGLQLVVTTVKVGSLLFIALLPFVLALKSSAAPGGQPHFEYLTAPPHRDFSWVGFGAALIAVQWAYHGWTNLGPVGEEVRDPQRNVPIALLGGIGVIIFVYCSANVAYSLVLTQPEMAKLEGTTVAAEFARRLLGPTGGALISGAIAVSTFGALNGNLLVGPRLLYAMGADGLAPRALAAVHPRYHTPAVATLVLAAWSAALVLIGAVLTTTRLPQLHLFVWSLDLNLPPNKSLFDVLTDFAMFGAVVFETMAVASIFMFRWKRPDADRPYRCVGYPWTPAVYVLCFVGVLASYFTPEKRVEAYSGLGFALAGAVVYGLFLRRRTTARGATT
jgi:basic amino acid/polyamine antiporter, APA family